MKTSIAATLVLALVTLRHSTAADDSVGIIEIGASTFAGKGCASPSDVSVALSADGKWLQVAFPTAFSAESGDGAVHTRVACNGIIPVVVPKVSNPHLSSIIMSHT